MGCQFVPLVSVSLSGDGILQIKESMALLWHPMQSIIFLNGPALPQSIEDTAMLKVSTYGLLKKGGHCSNFRLRKPVAFICRRLPRGTFQPPCGMLPRFRSGSHALPPPSIGEPRGLLSASNTFPVGEFPSWCSWGSARFPRRPEAEHGCSPQAKSRLNMWSVATWQPHHCQLQSKL